MCRSQKKYNQCILIFDGNCTREFLDFVKVKASKKTFTKYFVPANYSKLIDFKDNASYFTGFNLIINLGEAKVLLGRKKVKNSIEASRALFEKRKSEINLTIVTDGPNTTCGVSEKELAKVKPNKIKDSTSRLGAGDAFFAYLLSYKEMNPDASLKDILFYANKKTQKYLNCSG